ncbi:MAG: hypothetical protein VKN72_02095 [Nostocales cyanobacterium 94392]|nr:hypothetical protein [Nostocales cyanobacterium 94392]
MNSLLAKALTKLIRNRYAVFKTLIISMLILSLTACGGKAVSQDVSINLSEPIEQKDAQLSRKISEVAPPEVIQELRESLEVYQPQVKILNPQAEEVLQEDKLQVSLEVKDLPIFKNAVDGLGSHLKVILDNQPSKEVYDLNQPLELVDLSPGTHTLRVFASRPWHESFKNEGAYAQTKFYVFTKSDDNNPDESLPILTYNHPQGNYGAEPILLDFYLTNAPLHILAKDNPDSAIADWRIRCTINGESFIIDRWQSLYLKGFNAGKNWVKLEFLDHQGNPVKNVFNSTVRVINYESKGQDTLAKIVRGELTAEDLRGIVDANYADEIPVEKQVEKSAESTGGFFDKFKRGEDKTPTPQIIETPQPETNLKETIPEVIETPQLENDLKETIPEAIEIPQIETKLEPTPETTPEASKSNGFFNRFKREKQDTIIIPEVIETPQPETSLEEIIPEVIETTTPEFPIKETPTNTKLEPIVEPTPELPPTLPEIIEPLKNEAQIEVTPEAKQSTTQKLKEYFNLPRRKVPEVSPEVEVPENVPIIEQLNKELIEE